jgi:hypothetical protein
MAFDVNIKQHGKGAFMLRWNLHIFAVFYPKG